MKNKFITLLTMLSIILSLLGALIVFADETTAADLEIGTLAELEAFRDDVNNGNTYEGKTVKLTADIDMSEKYGEDKESWTPIGTLSWQTEVKDNLFKGTFDGNGHKIQNLYICKSSENIGLFCVNVGTIKNLEIASGTVMGTRCVGGVVGYNEGTVENCHNAIPVAYVGTSRVHSFGGIVGYNGGGGTIKNCRNSGNILGGGIVGGIVGWGTDSIVENCRNTGNVQATRSTTSMVGGIIGLSNGKVKDCCNSGNIGNDGITEVGGIAGFSGDTKDGIVENCYNTGDVLGDSEIGGIVGRNGGISDKEAFEGLIQNCYNTGMVSGKSYVGGIFGNIDTRDNAEKIIAARLQNCYNIGAVSGTEHTDGISAVDEGYVETVNSYCLDTCISSEQSNTAALTAEQFADKANFTNWDFETVWEMDTSLGRPVFKSNRELPPTPTVTPTIEPTATPTVEPTATPTIEPTTTPTIKPTATPTIEPTATPSIKPTPTATPTPDFSFGDILKYHDGRYIVEFEKNTDKNAYLILAVYSENALIAVDYKPLDSEYNGSYAEFIGNYKVSDDIKYVKIFAWNEHISPLCGVKTFLDKDIAYSNMD